MKRVESSLSSRARPPVQPNEVAAADDAICPYHKGLIRHTGDRDGKVFWCPIGREYWRYRKVPLDDFSAPVAYPKLGIV